MKTYLAGPINGCTDAEAKDWRAYVSVRLPDTLNPMRRDYRGVEAANVRDIVEGDKEDIRACDVLLVYFERPSVGTSMEVLFAWQAGKRVVVVNVFGASLSPWLLYHSTDVVDCLDAAIAILKPAPPSP